MVIESKNRSYRQSFSLRPVGHVKSDYSNYNEIPRPHGRKGWTDDISQIILYPEHAAKLKGLEGYSHIIVIYWIHKVKQWRMPRDHGKPPQVKLFGTRMPTRPNPIGLSVVRLVSFSPETGITVVKGLDALDQSPVLDIKPYIPDFDSFPEATLPGWVTDHLKKHHHTHE